MNTCHHLEGISRNGCQYRLNKFVCLFVIHRLHSLFSINSDSESSEEEDRHARRPRVKQQQAKGEGEEGKNTTNKRMSRRLTLPSNVDLGKSKRKSMRSMKLYSLSGEC